MEIQDSKPKVELCSDNGSPGLIKNALISINNRLNISVFIDQYNMTNACNDQDG